MPPQDRLYFASLLIGGRRYDTIEFSAAGLSFARASVEASELGALQRGDECAATLCLGGEGWKEVYSVVLRLAARGPAHLGFAFVTVPPAARRLLEQTAADRDDLGDSGASPWADGPAPFTFARLVEPEAPTRRFILPASEEVFAHTKERHEKNGPQAASLWEAPPPVGVAAGSMSVKSPLLPLAVLLAYGVAFLAVVVLFWVVVVA